MEEAERVPLSCKVNSSMNHNSSMNQIVLEIAEQMLEYITSK